MLAHPLGKPVRTATNILTELLRSYIVKSIKKCLVSSPEMDAVKRETNGSWRLIPSSPYPLLAWFQDDNFIKEIHFKEDGVKQCSLTEKG